MDRLVLALLVALAGCTGAAGPPYADVPGMEPETASLPPGGAGQRYEAEIRFGVRGGVEPPVSFALVEGAFPPGIFLEPAQEPGVARLAGIPRVPGRYALAIRARSGQIGAVARLSIEIGQGTIGILTPAADEGGRDPFAPAFPAAIDFVNPADPQAFFSFSFRVAGGSGRNLLRIHLPPELEASVFPEGGVWFLQAGSDKVQLGGFPSPPAPAGTVAPGPDRFQRAPADGGPPLAADGFSDYFDPRFEDGKYPFPPEGYVAGDGSRYRVLVEAIDTRGTPARDDDRIARKAYDVSVRVPPIVFETEALPGGQAGVDYAERVHARGGVPPLRFELERGGEFGLALDPETGVFLGIPLASGVVPLAVRVSGAVGEPARRAYPVAFLPPTRPRLVSTVLRPGVDGEAYPGDRLLAVDGVPGYRFEASHVRDASHGAAAGTEAPGLPNGLVLDALGRVGGVPLDRGFHTIRVRTTDSYMGDASAPDPERHRQSVVQDVSLGVSPDTAVYLRGAAGASGLLEAEACMAEPRMVPMFLEAALFRVDSGKTPLLHGGLPKTMDLLPVMLCNGGTDVHSDKSVPSVSGFWPAESGKLGRWWYPVYGYTELSWKHLQQETCWIETSSGRRVFLWAETKLASGNSGKRYQQYDPAGRHGVLVVDPRSGDHWIPAVLDAGDGRFGAEYVLSCAGSNPSADGYGYLYGGYMNHYHESPYTSSIRAVHLHGLGAFLEDAERDRNGRVASMGRTATSVAVSADGLWASTALPGGDRPRILLWRTDKAPIPRAILRHATALGGLDASGATLRDSACIVDLSALDPDPRRLLPDSLFFVRDGLVFLLDHRLDHVFGLDLVGGGLSARDLNEREGGISVHPDNGQFLPDQDVLRGQKATGDHAAQFSFAGNRPTAGEEGPDKVALVAGQNYRRFDLPDGSRAQAGNRAKSLLFLELDTGAEGLDLARAALRDLTGDDPRISGDLLPPGRPGEELDFLAVSPDGRYVAVVRDIETGGEYSSPAFGRAPSFATTSTSSTSRAYSRASDDLLIVSTTGEDLDTAPGVQTVLYLGTGNFTAGFSGTPAADSAPYASARPCLNAMGRRIHGVRFSDDGRALLFRYAGDDTHWTKYYGGARQYAVNSHPAQDAAFQGLSAEISVRVPVRDQETNGPIDFSKVASLLRNNLDGLSADGIAGLGPAEAPFRVTTGASDQQFWASFRSPNGSFQYYVVDQIGGRNYLVGFRVGADEAFGHAPYAPFTPHGPGVGFEQFDANAWNYESRIAATAGGIVAIVGADASAGPESAVDLEVYAFDADRGGDLVPLTGDVTDGVANAINHIHLSADGSVLVGQRARTAASSGDSREILNGDTDLFVVTNVRAALAGAAPDALVVSPSGSHGSTVAFVGEPPRALVFSAADAGGNGTWDDRTLRLAPLAPGVAPAVLDEARSHYAVLAAARLEADDPDSAD